VILFFSQWTNLIGPSHKKNKLWRLPKIEGSPTILTTLPKNPVFCCNLENLKYLWRNKPFLENWPSLETQFSVLIWRICDRIFPFQKIVWPQRKSTTLHTVMKNLLSNKQWTDEDTSAKQDSIGYCDLQIRDFKTMNTPLFWDSWLACTFPCIPRVLCPHYTQMQAHVGVVSWVMVLGVMVLEEVLELMAMAQGWKARQELELLPLSSGKRRAW